LARYREEAAGLDAGTRMLVLYSAMLHLIHRRVRIYFYADASSEAWSPPL